MISFTGHQGCLIVCGVVAIASGVLGWQVNGWRMSGDIETLKRKHVATLATAQAARADTEAKYRLLEKQRQSDIDKVVEDAQEKINRVSADAASARAAADGLRKQAVILASRCAAAGNPTAASGSPPATNPGDVLADVLGSVEAAGRAMAEEADRRGIAGSACERSYGALLGLQAK